MEDRIRQRYQSACRQYDIFGMAEAVRACMPALMAASPVDVCQVMWGGYYALACVGEIELLQGRTGNAAAYFVDWLRLVRRHDDVVFSEIINTSVSPERVWGNFNGRESCSKR